MNQFEAFKATLSEDSLKAIYEETKIEVAGDNLEGTETFSAALVTQMAINLLDKYHDWLNEEHKTS